MQQVKGAVLKSRLAFVEEHAGKDALAKVIASLPADDQRSLRIVFTSNWYPFELGKRLDDAIVQVLGKGRSDFFEKLGEASAVKNLGGIHSGYLTRGDAHGFLPRRPASTRPITKPAAESTRRSASARLASPPTTPKPSAPPTASRSSAGTRRHCRCAAWTTRASRKRNAGRRAGGAAGMR